MVFPMLEYSGLLVELAKVKLDFVIELSPFQSKFLAFKSCGIVLVRCFLSSLANSCFDMAAGTARGA